MAREGAPTDGRLTMRKMILTVLGSALLASSMVQVASAAEHHRGRTAVRVAAPVTAPLDANAYLAPAYPQPGYRYYGGGYSAPAGH